MVAIENHCCGCAVPAYPCRGDACDLTRVRVFYCDKCDQDTVALYKVSGRDLCWECITEIAERNGIDPYDLVDEEVM